MFCQHCGNKVEDNARFCGKCGRPVERVQAPARVQAQVQSIPAVQAVPVAPAAAAPAAAARPAGRRRGLSMLLVLLILLAAALFAFSQCRDAGESTYEGSGYTGGGYTGSLEDADMASGVQAQSGTQEATSTATAPAAQQGTGGTWTVLMYFCGSDLESSAGLATSNLVELQDAKLNSNVNWMVEAGGTTRWRNDLIDERRLMRYALSDGYYEEVGKLPLASMGKPDTLADFITWGVQEYPADHYMLIFWDHGGGSLMGVCADENFGDDMLTLPEIGRALAAAGAHFDVVGFDTCLMATLENAQVICPYADYMVASEELEPGAGWDYEEWTAWLCQNPGANGAEVGRVICDSYYDKCRRWRQQDTATLSVVDLSKIPALTEAFTGVASDMVLATADTRTFRALSQGARATEYYGGDASYDMVDLGDLVRHTSSVLGEQNYSNVLAALDEAVVYERHGSNRAGANGLSVFYPLYIDNSVFRIYKDVAQIETYLQLAAIMNGDYSAYSWSQDTPLEEEQEEPVTQDDYEILFNTWVSDGQYYNMKVTSGLESVVQVDFELALLLGDQIDDLSIVYLGSDTNVMADFQAGEFQDRFVGKWMAIDGHYVTCELMEERSDYNLYMVPAKVNGEEMAIWAVYDYANQRYDVLGIYDGYTIEDGPAGKSGRALEPGDEITFLFLAGDVADEGTEWIELDTMVWQEDSAMEDVDLGDGAFVYRFRIVDLFGTELTSDPCIMYIEGDGTKLTAMTLEDYLVNYFEF